MPSPELVSWVQSTNNGASISVLKHVPTLLLITVVTTWLIQHTLGTLWGELVKHFYGRRKWLNAVGQANAKLKAAEEKIALLEGQVCLEIERYKKLVIENDQLLKAFLQEKATTSNLENELRQIEEELKILSKSQ